MRFSTFPAGRSSITPPTRDAVITAIAARQHALVTFGQLLGTGLTDGAIAKRVARQVLHRVHRGVYSLVDPRALSHEAHALAAVLAAGEGSVLSHESLAVLHGVWRHRPARISVLSPTQRRPAGVQVHRCRRLDPRDVTTHANIPVTTIHRLLVDLADVLIAHEIANVIHEAAFKGRFVEAAVRDSMRRANGRRNLRVVERAIELHRAGSAGLKSRHERAFLLLVLDRGLPEPLVNTHLLGYERDFHWPERRLVVEIDSPSHSRPSTREADAHRDATLDAAGYAFLRFTDEDVTFRPAHVLS